MDMVVYGVAVIYRHIITCLPIAITGIPALMEYEMRRKKMLTTATMSFITGAVIIFMPARVAIIISLITILNMVLLPAKVYATELPIQAEEKQPLLFHLENGMLMATM